MGLKTSQSISKNIASNWITLLVGTIISLGMMPFLIRNLGKSAYGMWVLVMSATMYLQMLDMGVYSAVRRYVSRYHGQNDDDGINGTIVSAIVIFSGIGLGALLCGIIGSVIANKVFKIEQSDVTSFSFTFLIVSIGIALRFPLGLAQAAINAFQRYDITNAIEMSAEILRALLIVIAILSGFGILALGILYAADLIVRSLVEWYFLKRLYPELKVCKSLINKQHIKQIKDYSVISFGGSVLEIIHSQVDIVMVGVLYPPATVATYSVAKTLFAKALSVLGSVYRVFVPTVSNLEGAGRTSEIKDLWLGSLKLAFIIGSLFFVGLMTTGGAFIELWLGKGFEPAIPCLAILSVGLFIKSASGVSDPLFFGIGQHHYYLKLMVLNLCIAILLIFVLSSSLGITGIAIAMASGVATSSVVSTVIASKLVGVSFQEYRTVGLRASSVMVIFLGISFCFVSLIDVTRLPSFISFVALQTFVFLILSYVFTLKASERELLHTKLKVIFKLTPISR